MHACIGHSLSLVSVKRIEPVVQLKISFAGGHTATIGFIPSVFNRGDICLQTSALSSRRVLSLLAVASEITKTWTILPIVYK